VASWDPGGLDGWTSGVRDSTLTPSHVRWAGILLIAGRVIFWVGASAWFLGRPPLLERLELIASHRAAWYWINGSFLVSVTLTAYCPKTRPTVMSNRRVTGKTDLRVVS